MKVTVPGQADVYQRAPATVSRRSPRAFNVVGIRQTLVQPGPDVVRCERGTAALIAHHKRSPGRHPDDTSKTDPFPYTAHGISVPKLRG